MSEAARDLYEIYPCGDPYSRTWDACQSTDGGKSWFYRGDLFGLFTRAGLVRWIKQESPNAIIRNRY